MPTQDHADHIAKTRLAIRGMLAQLRKRVRPENLAQLIYLADNKRYEYTGESITGIHYIRAKHGPVAEDDVIIKQVDCLVEDGSGMQSPRPIRSRWHIPPLLGRKTQAIVWQEVKAAVGMGPDQFIIGIVMEYGSISSDSDIAAISKNTSAYKNASPTERIQFKQRERAIYLQNKLRSHPKFPEFAAGVRRGFADMEAGNWVSDDELMAELFDDSKPRALGD